MSTCHIELPSAAAVDLSVGVVTRNKGDLAEGEGVISRTVELDVGDAGSNGKENICFGDRDIDERI
jgi:hypothetical protein